jgi:DNA invertase Pin-like site-specific DNA recombinase
VVWKLDRLGRDLKHLVNTIDNLSQRNIGLKVLAGAGAQIDTTTANGRLVFGIFATLAEFAAELIRERTRAGLAAARARGRLGGRPRKMTKEVIKMAMAALADPKASPSEVAKRLGITTTTLYVYLNGDGSVCWTVRKNLSACARRQTRAGTMPLKAIPAEALLDLKRRLQTLAPQSAERRHLVQETAALYGISESTLYRRLRAGGQLRPAQRQDRGVPKVLPEAQLARYCELIAAIKIRISNKKRRLSTAEAIRLLEDYDLETPDGFVQAPHRVLKKPTVNRYLKQWGLDRQRLMREPPAVRFQARYSNALWQFDLSPSDLKHIERPPWVDERKKPPTLMLFSVVDDRSGTAYQEYRCTYGEEAEAALRFLFNAMAPKADEGLLLHGRPLALYMDPGPVSHSAIFQRVMRLLDIEVITHLPKGKDGRRTTARSKGKVERPFRTVKELHETLYHFHKPETEAEANAWLLNFLLRYNDRTHRSEPHSRTEDWLKNLPAEGICYVARPRTEFVARSLA